MTNHTLQKHLIQTGAVLCGTSVILGAFASHEIKDSISEQDYDTFQTAVRYMFLHSLAILQIGGMLRKLNEKIAFQIFWAFIIGIVLFCGSLFLLSTRTLTFGDSIKWFGGLTPIGGVLFIAGWGLLAYKGYKVSDGSEDHRSPSHRKGSKVTESDATEPSVLKYK